MLPAISMTNVAEDELVKVPWLIIHGELPGENVQSLTRLKLKVPVHESLVPGETKSVSTPCMSLSTVRCRLDLR